jgi:hypothetical protein
MTVRGEGQVARFFALRTKTRVEGKIPKDAHVRGHMETELLHMDDPRVLKR